MQYCTRCVYPSISAVPLGFDENGVCTGCRAHDQKKTIDWAERAEWIKEIADEYRVTDGSNYDCIIPVSGGKDSWYQTWYAKEVLGLNPLLVTYNSNNYLQVGLRNLKRMREVFGVDHHFFTPSPQTLIKLNRLCFKKMGDMNWHAHCGIFTYPVQVAVKYRIPLIIWGEHGYTDLGGMFSMNDLIEMTAKFRLEHAQRGYDWFDMLDREEGEEEGLQARDLLWARYPSDDELEEIEVRGIYLGNFVNWDGNEQTELMKKFGFEESPVPFDRTYRRVSNLDDMHENGIHDYLKFVKFGYGRASDHACKDIRSGKMTREEGVEMVRKYDHVKPRDLLRWLQYVGMSEAEFDAIADTFRDSRVWQKNSSGEWTKENIWGTPSAYPVPSLTESNIEWSEFQKQAVPQ
ncbi:N-acetyl sugar amidotransferase [Vampirovibrio chlorellavorus]|uniref:N-acetyl sugar amidotransferase n=1 Tax=Vampirovibrio chlorellavorus TaxID=758823 RepID=UPI0026EB8003|nr:N-acetyl sugar amidotransferase [Vampirovibrio chlorellavorus]